MSLRGGRDGLRASTPSDTLGKSRRKELTQNGQGRETPRDELAQAMEEGGGRTNVRPPSLEPAHPRWFVGIGVMGR